MAKYRGVMLEKTALNIRRKILRQLKAGGGGHIGGALSAADILTALYFSVMTVNPQDPGWEERDRFVLSAGHKCLALYATLAEKGFFDESLLGTYGQLGSKFPGHPDMHKVPGIEANTGALGHGLAIAGGMAMGLKLSDLSSRVYVLMGDGELAEGSNWEAAAAAAHHRLDNMLVVVDRNSLQIGGKTTEVMSFEPLADKWRAFGWAVRTINGHDMRQIVEHAGAAPFESTKPSLIIADTIKGKGLSFAEGQAGYHHWKATPADIEAAEAELEEIGRNLGA